MVGEAIFFRAGGKGRVSRPCQLEQTAKTDATRQYLLSRVGFLARLFRFLRIRIGFLRTKAVSIFHPGKLPVENISSKADGS